MVEHDPAGGGRALSQWLAHIESVHFRSVDLGLDRVSAVLQKLLPQGPSFIVITVAGTNGKGSAVEMLSAIYSQTNLCVGTYTSPHLVSYTERVQVNRQEVAQSELCAAFEEIERSRVDIPLTYFEFGTLAALLIFQNRGVQLALLEVGMGGRLDAVNAVDPSVALISSVAIDHQSWLGSDREAIAVEKAGIMRKSRPVICAEPEPPLTIAQQAERIGAKLYQLGEHFSYTSHGDRWHWIGPGVEMKNLPMPQMIGGFQLQNASGVLMVVTALSHAVSLSEGQIHRGLSSARLRGRFEIVQSEPMIVLDVAHNLAAAVELSLNLDAFSVDGQTLAVCGMLQDKPVAEIAAQLETTVDAWYLGSIQDARGCTADELAQAIKTRTTKPIFTHDSVVAAYHAACKRAAFSDRIVVFGSFHTVGDIIAALKTDNVVH